MIKKFGEYINEGVRDKMTPKSEEDIKKSLQGLNPYEKMDKAIRFGILSIVKDIIESGIDLKKNMGGGTPASYRFVDSAIDEGKLDILKYLLDNGCSLQDMQDYQLDNAITGGHYDVAKFLVDEYGANVNDQEGDAYLQMAVDQNNLGMVKLVIDLECEYFDDEWLNDIILSDRTDPEIIKYMMDKVYNVKEFIQQMHKDYKKGVEILNKYV